MDNDEKTLHIAPPKRIEYAVATALFVLACFLIVQAVSVVQNFSRPENPATDTITVQGDGKATLPPDVARISFTVENTKSTVSEAQDVTTEQANSAIDFVKEQGIAEKDIKTLSYNISPQYSYPNPCVLGMACPEYSRTPKITGYQVSETIQVTMRDLTKIGALLGGLGELEVQNVSGPEFALDDSTAGYDAARADAISKAKKQANLLEKQLGVHLGKIVNFSESSGYSYPRAYDMGMGVSSAKTESTPSVPIGENTYSASVSITYEIR